MNGAICAHHAPVAAGAAGEGRLKNPYVLNRSPLGSRSGSAVAVASNLCCGAIGAEVDGSIVRPASSNSIVGLKPTVGLISTKGIIGVLHLQDTAGPMIRTVTDAAILLSALNPGTYYQKLLDRNSLQGARLGVARECFGAHEGTNSVNRAGHRSSQGFRRCNHRSRSSEPSSVLWRVRYDQTEVTYFRPMPAPPKVLNKIQPIREEK